MLHIERVESGPATVLRLQGEIDGDEMNDLRLVLMNCIQDKRCNVVLNMEQVTFISYMGVGVLVERVRQLRDYNGDLKLVGANLYTKRLLRMVGVTNVFELYDIEGLAVQQYQQAA